MYGIWCGVGVADNTFTGRRTTEKNDDGTTIRVFGNSNTSPLPAVLP